MKGGRYETFVGCPDLLIDTFAYWFGVDLHSLAESFAKNISGSSLAHVYFENDAQWRARVINETSIETNILRAERLGRNFTR